MTSSEYITEKINEVINHIGTSIPAIIDNVQKQMQRISSTYKEHFQKFAHDAQERISKVTADSKASIETKKKAQEELAAAIDKLWAETESSLQKCHEVAHGKMKEVSKKGEVMMEKTKTFYLDVKARVERCIEENKKDPLKLPQSLKEQVEPVQNHFECLQKEVHDVLNTMRKETDQILEDTEHCLQNVEEKSNKEVDQIIQKYRRAVSK